MVFGSHCLLQWDEAEATTLLLGVLSRALNVPELLHLKGELAETLQPQLLTELLLRKGGEGKGDFRWSLLQGSPSNFRKATDSRTCLLFALQ